MNFPAINFTIQNWNPNSYQKHIIRDKYIYSDDENLFNNFYKNMEFIDSNGDIYTLVEKRKPTSQWRILLSFIPKIYRIEFVFKKTHQKIDLTTLKEFAKHQISRLSDEEYIEEWKSEIDKLKSVKEIIEEM